MSKYAIIQLGGKQFKIEEKQKIKLERQKKLDVEVLLYNDGKTITIGNPTVKGVVVDAKIVNDEIKDKTRVARFRSKSRHRRVKGHKQPMCVVEILSIGKQAKPATKSKKSTQVKKVTKAKK